MDWIWSFIDLFQHLDLRLDTFIHHYGIWTYLVLFLIIFCETGLVVTPFLPGDSLLLIAGTLAGDGSIDIRLLLPLLAAAAILGNSLNYGIGYLIGPSIFHFEKSKLFKHENLVRTHRFYEKYGAVTILVSRFIPVVRAFAPFVAGIGRMDFRKFSLFNTMGGIGWISVFILLGYFFGKIRVIRENSTLTMVGLLVITLILLPFIIRQVSKLMHHHTEK